MAAGKKKISAESGVECTAWILPKLNCHGGPFIDLPSFLFSARGTGSISRAPCYILQPPDLAAARADIPDCGMSSSLELVLESARLPLEAMLRPADMW